MMRCVQCDNELVAPERSEYWSNKHACHIWLCPTCSACFEFAGLVFYRRRINGDNPDRGPVTVTVAAGRVSARRFGQLFSFALAACPVRLIQFTAPFRQLRRTRRTCAAARLAFARPVLPPAGLACASRCCGSVAVAVACAAMVYLHWPLSAKGWRHATSSDDGSISHYCRSNSDGRNGAGARPNEQRKLHAAVL